MSQEDLSENGKGSLPNSILSLKNGINLLTLDDFSNFSAPKKSHFCRFKTKKYCFFSVIFENGFAVFAIATSNTQPPRCILKKNLRGTISKCEVWAPFYDAEEDNQIESDDFDFDPLYCVLVAGDEQNPAFPKNQIMFLNISEEKQEINQDLTLFCKEAVLDVFLINFSDITALQVTKFSENKPQETKSGEMCVVLHEKVLDIYLLKKPTSSKSSKAEKKDEEEEGGVDDLLDTKSSFLSGDPKYESFSSFAKTGAKNRTQELLEQEKIGKKKKKLKKLTFFPKPALSFPLNEIESSNPSAGTVVHVSHNVKHGNILIAHTTAKIGIVKFISFKGTSLLYLASDGEDGEESLLFNPNYCPIKQAESITKGKSIEFKCHDSPITILRLSSDGKMLATASENGKFIRFLFAFS